MTLAYHPAVDLTQPIPLVLDDRRLGPVTIGWITPGEVEDPQATTIPLTHETDPLPGHQSLHRPAATAVVKAGYDGTEDADGEMGTAATRPELAPTRVFFEPPLPRFAPVLPTLPETPGQPFSPPTSSSPSHPTRMPRSGSTIRQERVQGHPDLYGSVTTFSSDHTGDVTIRRQGVNGMWGADIGTYDMDADGTFRDGGQGPVLGTVRPDGIHLTREGETKLVPNFAGPKPPAATPPQRGFVHDMPRDREEEDIVNDMRLWGASAEQIQEALDTHRYNKARKAAADGGKEPTFRRGSKKPKRPDQDPTKAAAAQKLISELLAHPETLAGKTPQEIAKMFEDVGLTVTLRQSKRRSKRAVLIDIETGTAGSSRISRIEVHPGGGRHEGQYYVISTSSNTNSGSGKIRIVNPSTYVRGTEPDKIVDVPGLVIPDFPQIKE